MSKKRILIVEDERLSAEYLKEIVIKNGYEVVDICSRGKDAIKAAIKYKPDLIFMDIMLKDNISGSEAALKIQTMIDTKIIFLTAHYEDEMLEYAIISNAANYILKPYTKEQVLIAIKLAFKNSKNNKIDSIALKNGLSYNFNLNKLYNNGIEINLNDKENSLIKYLCENIDTVISYKQCSIRVYGEDSKISALRALISRLNRKANFPLIETMRGIGYKICSK